MRATKMNSLFSKVRFVLAPLLAVASLLTATAANATAPGITGPKFYLTAKDAYISQPDGAAVYFWGDRCGSKKPPSGFFPAAITDADCLPLQVPRPELDATEGE